MAVTLVLRFADVGIATYASLRVVGEPARTVTWGPHGNRASRALGETNSAARGDATQSVNNCHAAGASSCAPKVRAISSSVAGAVLLEVHGARDRTAIEVLNRYVADPHVVAGLTDQLGHSWSDVRAGPDITGPFLAGLSTVLGPADGHSAAAARQRVWSALIADATPYNLGAKAHSAAAELPWSITELGLSSVEPQRPPPIVGGSDSDRPLNRSVVDRVRATLPPQARIPARTVPARSPREPIRSTGARFLLASSTRPSAPSGGASRRPMASRKPLCTWSCQVQDWRRGSRCGCGRATSVLWRARRRRRSGVPGRGRGAAARHRIGCVRPSLAVHRGDGRRRRERVSGIAADARANPRLRAGAPA